jgi:hypothetical protein
VQLLCHFQLLQFRLHEQGSLPPIANFVLQLWAHANVELNRAAISIKEMMIM